MRFIRAGAGARRGRDSRMAGVAALVFLRSGSAPLCRLIIGVPSSRWLLLVTLRFHAATGGERDWQWRVEQCRFLLSRGASLRPGWLQASFLRSRLLLSAEYRSSHLRAPCPRDLETHHQRRSPSSRRRRTEALKQQLRRGASRSAYTNAMILRLFASFRSESSFLSVTSGSVWWRDKGDEHL